MDPSSIISAAGKEIVIAVIKEMLKRLKIIDETLSEEFKVLGKEMKIEYPQSIQHCSIAFKTKGSRILPLKKKFNFGKVRRVSLRPLTSLQPVFDAVSYTDNGFEINLRKLEEDTYLLDIDYFIEDRRFIDALVNRNVARESPGVETKEYWIVAQLKHLDVLKQEFGFIELKDLDFSIDISVYNEIKMRVPHIFRRQLEIAVKLLSKQYGGRDEQFKLLQQHKELLRARKEKYYGEIFEILEQIQEIFSPLTFRRFVDVQKDFHYHNCERGKDFYDTLPFPTWPKSMKVISRTDLNFNKPAADGLLIFKKRDFMNELKKIFQ